MTHRLRLLVVAVVLLGLGAAQAGAYARSTRDSDARDGAYARGATRADHGPRAIASDVEAELAEVTAETSCSELRTDYAATYNAWRSAVKKRDEVSDEELLVVMRATLRRIYDLEFALRCGG